ncbi:MAG: glycosyltransferase, partial [Candidatus Cloacimonadales bacterium]
PDPASPLFEGRSAGLCGRDGLSPPSAFFFIFFSPPFFAHPGIWSGLSLWQPGWFEPPARLIIRPRFCDFCHPGLADPARLPGPPGAYPTFAGDSICYVSFGTSAAGRPGGDPHSIHSFVTLLAPLIEPFGLVAIEALACGTPVVATKAGGLPDFINSEVGKLVEMENPAALAEAIIAELAAEAKQEKGPLAARYALEKYSWAHSIEAVRAIYQSALD